MKEKQEQTPGRERRRYMRFDIPLDLKFRTSQRESSFIAGHIRNFSRHGFCFETSSTVPALHKTMDFEIALPDGTRFVSATGDIVWKQTVNEKYFAGIKIREMDKAAKSEILDYGYDRWIETVRNREDDSFSGVYSG